MQRSCAHRWNPRECSWSGPSQALASSPSPRWRVSPALSWLTTLHFWQNCLAQRDAESAEKKGIRIVFSALSSALRPSSAVARLLLRRMDEFLAWAFQLRLLDQIPVNPTESQSVRPNPSQSDPIPVSPTQSQSIRPNPSQSDPIPVSPTKSQSIPPNQGQSGQIRVNPAKSESIRPNPGQSDQVRVNPTKSQSIPPNQGQSHQIKVNPTNPTIWPVFLLRGNSRQNGKKQS